MGAHQSAVSYIPDGDFKRAVHGMSLSERYEKYRSYDVMPTGAGIWSLIFENAKPMRMTEAELHAHPRFLNFSEMKDDRGLAHPPLPGWLAMPVVRRNGDAIGVLQLSDKFEGDFTEEDEATAKHAAVLIASTLELQYVNDELQQKTDELKRFSRLTMGREMRIIELKKQVNDLSERLGEPPPFDPAYLEGDDG